MLCLLLSRFFSVEALARAAADSEVPEHDAITRRLQFGHKKEKAAEKKENIAKKKSDKAEKKIQKEQNKKGKADQKIKAKNEKMKRKKKKKRKLRLEQKKTEKDEKKHSEAWAAERKENNAEKPEGATPSKEAEPEASPPHGKRPKTKAKAKASPRKSPMSKLARLRRMQSMKVGALNGQDSQANRGKKPKNTKTKQEKEPKGQSAKRGNTPRLDQKPAPEGQPCRKRRKSEQVSSKPEYEQMVHDILEECKASHCTHPEYVPLEVDKQVMKIVPYWNRKHAGVELEKSYVPTKKPTKSGFCNVVYFSCNTCCPYTNIALAFMFVPWCSHARVDALRVSRSKKLQAMKVQVLQDVSVSGNPFKINPSSALLPFQVSGKGCLLPSRRPSMACSTLANICVLSMRVCPDT